MNLAISIGLNIITLAGIVCCLSFVFASKKLLAGLSLAWIFLFNIPFMEWSLCDYVYALFDVPSVMLIYYACIIC